MAGWRGAHVSVLRPFSGWLDGRKQPLLTGSSQGGHQDCGGRGAVLCYSYAKGGSGVATKYRLTQNSFNWPSPTVRGRDRLLGAHRSRSWLRGAGGVRVGVGVSVSVSQPRGEGVRAQSCMSSGLTGAESNAWGNITLLPPTAACAFPVVDRHCCR